MLPRRALLCRTAAAVFSAALAFAAPPASATGVCPLLLQQTQAFSDASQRGDATVLARLLDGKVIFVNEAGEVGTKQDLVSGAAPSPNTAAVKMTVMDWQCQLHGDSAVTSFIDDQALGGQPVHTQFRSVETWQKESADWRMIGSETLTVPADPPTTTLPAAVLDEYVGNYAAGPGLQIAFSRQGKMLMASLNGGPASAQAAETTDVFFTPGRGQFRKIFQRDPHGKIIDFIYLREGHDLIFKKV